MEKNRLDNKIDLHRMDSLVRDISPINDLRALLHIYRFIKGRNYQVVHTHTAKAGVLGRIAAKMAGVPYIIHDIHGITFPETINVIAREIFKNIELFCGLFTDHFITVGEDMKQKYLDVGIGSREDYTVIHSGMEMEEFYRASGNSPQKVMELKEALGIKKGSTVIGMVSKLEARKDYRYYISIAERIINNHPDTVFLIVGHGPRMDELKEEVKKRNLSQNVVFTGYRSDIADVFSMFDIKVLTSLWEGLPRVLVQAAAVGLPIVTFDVDGAWEVVEDEENGYVVPIRDVDALVDKIDYLLENEDMRDMMGEKSREMVGDSWSVGNMVEKTVQLYDELLS